MAWNFVLMFTLVWWLVVDFFFVGFFFERYLLNVKGVIGSVYQEESRSEIKLDCELMDTSSMLSIHSF